MKEKIDERIKNIPDKIYLQVGDNIGWEVDFKELEDTGEVTWCSDKIENWDIEYIRASELEHLVNQEVEKRMAERMPSRDCENRELDRRKRYDEAMGYNEIKALEKGIKFGMRFYKRLLTNSSQKTEGGE